MIQAMDHTSKNAPEHKIHEIISFLKTFDKRNFKLNKHRLKKISSELKNSFLIADKETRNIYNILAKYLQQDIFELDELRQSLYDLRSVYAMAREIKKAGSREEILSVLREFAGKIIPVKASSILIAEKEEYRIIKIDKKSDQLLKDDFNSFIEEGIIDWVMEENRPVVIEDYETIGGGFEIIEEKNIVLVPLTFQGNKQGVLLLYTSKPKDEFTNRDLELLSALSDQEELAVTNF